MRQWVHCLVLQLLIRRELVRAAFVVEHLQQQIIREEDSRLLEEGSLLFPQA